jgi:hypothetical protein
MSGEWLLVRLQVCDADVAASKATHRQAEAVLGPEALERLYARIQYWLDGSRWLDCDEQGVR